MNLSETPVAVILPTDTSTLAESAGRQIDEVIGQAEASAVVTAARNEFETLLARLDGLTAARDALNSRGKTLGEYCFAAEQRIEDAILSPFLGGAAEDYRALLEEHAHKAAEAMAVSRALASLYERHIPEGAIARYRAESRLFHARAREVERLANERFERVAETLRAAAELEHGLMIDTRNSLSGALLKKAQEFFQKAVQLSQAAEAEEQAYKRLHAKGDRK